MKKFITYICKLVNSLFIIAAKKRKLLTIR